MRHRLMMQPKSILATLNDLKLVTRRVVTARNSRIEVDGERHRLADFDLDHACAYPRGDTLWAPAVGGNSRHLYPIDSIYRPGDDLYFCETWAVASCLDHSKPSDLGHPRPNVQYKVDGAGSPVRGRWRSPLYMPYWACRVVRRVASVSAERLQDISDRDVQDEGVDLWYWHSAKGTPKEEGTSNPQELFSEIWDGINGHRPGCLFADNSWVWAPRWEVVK